MKHLSGKATKAIGAATAFLLLAGVFLFAPLQTPPGLWEASAGGGKVTFYGHGRGHGVGLCMAGVYYRALRGEEYHQIIRQYYTGIEFSRGSDDRQIKVLCRDNVVRTYTMREYLYRLQEEPDNWPMEGLKVTMVAARTYALSCIARGKHAGSGYDICPYGSCCQAFNENINVSLRPHIVAAVNATAGEIITYNGQPIIAAYSSCCGGHTASMEEAWGGTNQPYLQPVPDDACAPDEDHDWEVSMDWNVLEAKLNSRAETAVGTLYGFEIVSQWASGRVNKIRIDGSAGSKIVSGRLFASVVGLETHFFTTEAQNFDEYLLIQNPGDEEARCTVTYMFPGGGTLEEDCLIRAHSRYTAYVNDRVQNSEVSVKVKSDRPVVAERAMYFDFLGSGRKGGHACMGVREASERWYFAEGYTGGLFDTFFLVQNPNGSEAKLKVSFMGGTGEVDELFYTLAPLSRMTIWMDQEPGLDDGEFSVSMSCDLPVVAERAMYFGYNGLGGGTASEGSVESAGSWYFAEGYTGGDFDTWILLANPNDGVAAATLQFMLPDASTKNLDIEIPGHSRYTVHVNDIPGLEDTEFSTRVQAEQPVVAERAMYFRYFGKEGGHDALGAKEPSGSWYFAEGYTGGDFDTWILLQNPNDDVAAATLQFMLPDASIKNLGIEIPGHSRYTVHVNDIPGLEDTEFSTRVQAEQPVVAERAMYFSYRSRDGGSCSEGTRAPSTDWYFAEGYTGS